MKNRRNFFHFIKYILVSLLVFISAVVISIIARMFLVADCLFWGFTEDQASLVTSMLEGVVGAIAAGLVLYQLKLSNDVEERQNSIEEARFILQYNQAFIQDASICKVEQLLEQSMLHEINTPIINQENRQLFINYLVYLEGLAPLILRDVLQLKHVDDLFAYRFFWPSTTENSRKRSCLDFLSTIVAASSCMKSGNDTGNNIILIFCWRRILSTSGSCTRNMLILPFR